MDKFILRSCNSNYLFLSLFRLPRLYQRIFSQLYGVLSHCSKLVQLYNTVKCEKGESVNTVNTEVTASMHVESWYL